MIDEIVTSSLPRDVGAFSQAVRTPSNAALIWVSGEVSRDSSGQLVGENDIRKQTETVLNNITTILSEAGCTLDDVVRVTVYIRDMADFDAIHEVRRRYFKPPYPASTMVEVSRLVDDRYLIEIDAVALSK